MPGVNTINSTVHQRHQLDLTRSRLGRLGNPASMNRSAAPTRVQTRPISIPDPTRARFPAGCRTRRIDSSGRIKLQLGGASINELLGWADGALDVVVTDGWAVLTQRPELIDAPRARNSAFGGFSIARDVERIALRPAHLNQIGLAAGDEALIAVIPDVRALVICDPDLILAVAPPAVTRLIAPPVDDTDATSVIDIATHRSAPTVTSRAGGIR